MENLHGFSIKKNLDELNHSNPEEKIKYLKKLTNISNYVKENYGIEIRDDSQLIWSYLTEMQETPKTISYVSEEIWFTTILYRYTDYEMVSKKNIPEIKYFLMKGHEEHPLCSQQTWEHIRNFVIPSLKIDCMAKLIEKIPNVRQANSEKK